MAEAHHSETKRFTGAMPKIDECKERFLAQPKPTEPSESDD